MIFEKIDGKIYMFPKANYLSNTELAKQWKYNMAQEEIVVKSNPSLFSKQHKSVCSEIPILLKVNERFILSGKGSQPQDRELRYYWKLVKGINPPINEVSLDGRDVYFSAPSKPTDIEFELKVKEKISGKEDTKIIKIKVVEE